MPSYMYKSIVWSVFYPYTICCKEKETTVNSLNPVASGEQFHDSECNRSPIQKVTYDDKDDTCNSESRIVTVDKETTVNSLIPVASVE